MKQSSAMLLVMGPNWLTATEGVSPYVRQEIELALQYHVKIIPVLVHDGVMPAPTVLPASIQSIVSLNGNTVHVLDPYFRTDMERLAPVLGIGKKTAARGGSYWGITKPRYLLLSLLALATCISVVIQSLIYTNYYTGTASADVQRWNQLSIAILLLAGIPTVILFLVRTVGKHWSWLIGSLLAFVPGAIASILVGSIGNGNLVTGTLADKLITPLSFDWSLLVPGLPSFLILLFAVFGPSSKARQIFFWGLFVAVVLCASWTYWYVS